MTLQEEVHLLRRVPLFSKIDPARLKLLAFTSDRLVFAPDDVLFEQGQTGDAAYLILSGSAKVEIDTPSGKLTIATINEHEIVGEIAILCDVPRTATVRAAGELVALRIAKDRFFTLLTEFPEMAVEMMRELARRLEVTTMRLREAHARLGAAGAE
jgi:CRP/FNR family cyclic AMP-dependent transcriptional regulator